MGARRDALAEHRVRQEVRRAADGPQQSLGRRRHVDRAEAEWMREFPACGVALATDEARVVLDGVARTCPG